MQKCDAIKVERFDYSALDSSFSKLPKPAQRALINNNICSPLDLAKWTLKDVCALHGIGPSSVPKLKEILRKKKMRFKNST